MPCGEEIPPREILKYFEERIRASGIDTPLRYVVGKENQVPCVIRKDIPSFLARSLEPGWARRALSDPELMLKQAVFSEAQNFGENLIQIAMEEVMEAEALEQEKEADEHIRRAEILSEAIRTKQIDFLSLVKTAEKLDSEIVSENARVQELRQMADDMKASASLKRCEENVKRDAPNGGFPAFSPEKKNCRGQLG